MYNIKKIYIFVILIFLALGPCGQTNAENNHTFTLGPVFGFLYGQAEEIVYRFPGNDEHLSLLLWDLKPLFYAGLIADFRPINLFRDSGNISSLSFKIGIPARSGIMENMDWLGTENSITHYSRHNVYTDRAIHADFSFGRSWPLNNFFAFAVLGELSYKHYHWVAKDGYGIYPFGERLFTGPVIEYTQNWFVLAPGISLSAGLGRFFLFEAGLNYAPGLFSATRDLHIERNTVFQDYVWKGHYFKAGANLVFTPDPSVSLSLFFNYIYTTEIRGNTYVNNTLYRDLGGARYSAMDTGLLFTFSMN